MKLVLEILRREERLCLVQIRDMPGLPADSEEERMETERRVQMAVVKLGEIREAIGMVVG